MKRLVLFIALAITTITIQAQTSLKHELNQYQEAVKFDKAAREVMHEIAVKNKVADILVAGIDEIIDKYVWLSYEKGANFYDEKTTDEMFSIIWAIFEAMQHWKEYLPSRLPSK